MNCFQEMQYKLHAAQERLITKDYRISQDPCYNNSSTERKGMHNGSQLLNEIKRVALY